MSTIESIASPPFRAIKRGLIQNQSCYYEWRLIHENTVDFRSVQSLVGHFSLCRRRHPEEVSIKRSFGRQIKHATAEKLCH